MTMLYPSVSSLIIKSICRVSILKAAMILSLILFLGQSIWTQIHVDVPNTSIENVLEVGTIAPDSPAQIFTYDNLPASGVLYFRVDPFNSYSEGSYGGSWWVFEVNASDDYQIFYNLNSSTSEGYLEGAEDYIPYTPVDLVSRYRAEYGWKVIIAIVFDGNITNNSITLGFNQITVERYAELYNGEFDIMYHQPCMIQYVESYNSLNNIYVANWSGYWLYPSDEQTEWDTCHFEKCFDSDACNYSPGGSTLNVSEADCYYGSNDYPGYYPPGDCYYLEDCSCVGEVIDGCTDPNSCLYNPQANICGYGQTTACWQVCREGEGFYPGESCYDNQLNSWGVRTNDCECFVEISGCTDAVACNFKAGANANDGSCCYEFCGCTDVEAQNYDSSAQCSVNTCQYRVAGIVFYDENEDGTQQPEEYGLSFQNLTIEPEGLQLITNDEGEYSFESTSGAYTITLGLSDNFPFPTNTNPKQITLSGMDQDGLDFGVSNELVEFAICIDLYPDGNGSSCNDYSTHNICYRNMGNVPIDGVVELEYDELFQGYQEITAIDSVNGNKVYMSFENLLPGEMFFYDVSLLTPTEDHIGENVTSTARVYGYYDEEQVAYGEQELTMEVTCAYDPNDKQAFPQGYTEDHLLLQQTEQEFLVRFQNTGNAAAQNVRIIDTLDVNWDLSTLEIVANSHSVMTKIDTEKRVVDFFFEDIMLPDSVNNEPDSHGLISYKITPLAGLQVGTELNNTAYIYFDNNDPIVTNTTWTTIHECGGESEFDLATTTTCLGELIWTQPEYEWIENHSWSMGEEVFSTEADAREYINELGEYTLSFTASNALCEESSSIDIVIDNLEQIDPCIGDINCDGAVGVEDLGTFLSDFGCHSGCIADLNGDGFTIVSDLTLFLLYFGKNCAE